MKKILRKNNVHWVCGIFLVVDGNIGLNVMSSTLKCYILKTNGISILLLLISIKCEKTTYASYSNLCYIIIQTIYL